MAQEARVKRAVIIHGTYGAPTENWFPWLASRLRDRGVHVDLPTLPTPKGQSLDAWMTAFNDQVALPGPDTVLIGHSMGVGFIVRLLSSLPTPVAGCVLASGFMRLLDNEEFDPLNSTFVQGHVDWGICRARAGRVIAFHGSDDPYVPVSYGEEVANCLGGVFHLVQDGGHLNAGAGLSEFPQLEKAVLSIV